MYLNLLFQLMCDHKMMIRNVVASWQGSAHDSRIFNESTCKTYLEQLPSRFHILGDRGYPLSTYLLTPFPNPRTPAEKRFNFAQSSSRMIIERVNGNLKRRFPCLRYLSFRPEKCAAVTVTCIVLYNLGRLYSDTYDLDDENDGGP